MGQKVILTPEQEEYVVNNAGKISLREMESNIGVGRHVIARCLKELGTNYYLAPAWGDEEVQKLRELAPNNTWIEIAELLNKTPDSVQAKACELKIKSGRQYPKLSWTKDQEEYVVNNAGKMSIKAMSKAIGITCPQISKKLKSLGIDYLIYSEWTDEDISKLTELAPKYYPYRIAHLMNRTEKAIRAKAKELKIALLNSTAPHIWTTKEISYLKSNAGKISISKMSKALNINCGVIAKKLKKLEIHYVLYTDWTEEEVQKLKELAPFYCVEEIAKILNRTIKAIKKKAFNLDIPLIKTKREFTADELMYITSNWNSLTIDEMAVELKCNSPAIRLIGRKLELPSKRRKRKWTEEKIAKIRELATTMTAEEIASFFDVAIASIYQVTHENKIKILDTRIVWTDKENDKLRRLALLYDEEEIASRMKKVTASIKHQARRLGLKLKRKAPRKQRLWTEEEDKKLIELAKQHSIKEIANILDRTETAVYIEARKLKITILGVRRKWTTEDDEELKDLWGNYPIETICKKLNRTIASVKFRASKMQLGYAVQNYYEGLTIYEICTLLRKEPRTIEVTWAVLGLNIKQKKVSNYKSYKIVAREDLLDFLEKHQDLWDSKTLDKNILGKEPSWLIEKRIRDLNDYKKAIHKNIIRETVRSRDGYYDGLKEQLEKNVGGKSPLVLSTKPFRGSDL